MPTLAYASRPQDQVFEKLEHAVKRKFDRCREQKKEKRSLAEIVGDRAADLIFHIVGKIGFDKTVERVGERQQLDVAPAQPIDAVGVQISVDRIDDDDGDQEQQHLAQKQPDKGRLAARYLVER